MSRRLDPPISILNPEFRYTKSEHTDLRARFKRMGWRPPSEYRVVPITLRKAKP